MLIRELIEKLKKYEGDKPVIAVHTDHSWYYDVVEVTRPDNVNAVAIVTVPFDWYSFTKEGTRVSKENNDERTETVREEEVSLNSDEDRTRKS